MTKKELKYQIKEEQKVIAQRIHDLKATRKEDKRGGRTLSIIEYEIWGFKTAYRTTHIAYCMYFNFRTIDEIECTSSINYDDYYIGDYYSLIEKWTEEVEDEEILRDCA